MPLGKDFPGNVIPKLAQYRHPGIRVTNVRDPVFWFESVPIGIAVWAKILSNTFMRDSVRILYNGVGS
jgi:hypothetical protein